MNNIDSACADCQHSTAIHDAHTGRCPACLVVCSSRVGTGVRYVAQPNDYGCAIACCAMVLGKTYEEVEADLRARGHKGGSIYESIWEQYLHEHGFALTRKYRHDCIANKTRDEWPPGPWAPIHIALLQATAGAHAVVMLANGAVLDPFKRSRGSLCHPDYKAIDFVMGFHRIDE